MNRKPRKSGIWARSILASVHSGTKARLDSILCRFPRSILPEVNTHRTFSGNTGSSRAVPIAKIIEQVERDPFIPEVWGSNQPGMQAGAECFNHVLTVPRSGSSACTREHAWLYARDDAVRHTKAFAVAGYHKQIVNRLLEPWMWTIKLISATEWDNFFTLRDHPDAEPHMQILAKAIRKARDEARVEILNPGVWHLPFVKQKEHDQYTPTQLQILSVARCASTSYKTVDDFDMTLDRAKKIYEQLLSDPLHASPFEHVALTDTFVQGAEGPYGKWEGGYLNLMDHRNFRGFRQMRAFVEREKRATANLTALTSKPMIHTPDSKGMEQPTA